MRLKEHESPFNGVNPPYRMLVIHSSKLIYSRELYQRGVQCKRVEEQTAVNFNKYKGQRVKAQLPQR